MAAICTTGVPSLKDAADGFFQGRCVLWKHSPAYVRGREGGCGGVVCWRGVVISMRDATPVCQQTSQNNASADHVVWADGRPPAAAATDTRAAGRVWTAARFG